MRETSAAWQWLNFNNLNNVLLSVSGREVRLSESGIMQVKQAKRGGRVWTILGSHISGRWWVWEVWHERLSQISAPRACYSCKVVGAWWFCPCLSFLWVFSTLFPKFVAVLKSQGLVWLGTFWVWWKEAFHDPHRSCQGHSGSLAWGASAGGEGIQPGGCLGWGHHLAVPVL